ncbi:MAG: hypothetical protein O7J95_07395 [Planctomycetota bacterium]|nr:hypothetical protein [Planctomycetota bacterium]
MTSTQFLNFPFADITGQESLRRACSSVSRAIRRGLTAPGDSDLERTCETALRLWQEDDNDGAAMVLFHFLRDFRGGSSRDVLGKFAGDYEFESGALLFVTQESGRLYLESPGLPKAQLLAARNGRFFLKRGRVSVTFRRGRSGAVQGLVLREDNHEYVCRKAVSETELIGSQR